MAHTLIPRMAILALLGVGAGTVHSYLRPVQVLPKSQAPAPPTYTSSPAGVGDAGPGTTSTTPTTPQAQQSLEFEISVPQAFELYQQGRPFLDARNLDDFTKSHVEGAFWLPAEAFSGGRIPAAMNYLDPALEVVIYCSGGHCDASHNVAILLQQAGFKRCHIMTDGLPGWVSAGHAVAAGKPEGME